MSTRREQILEAIVDALNVASVTVRDVAKTKPSGFTAERSRVRMLADTDLAGGWAGVYPSPRESVDVESVHPQVARSLSVTVSLRTAGGEIADSVIDPLHLWCVFAVMADTTLGELAVAIREVGTTWYSEELDTLLPGCDVEFEALYVTDEANQELYG